MGKEARKVTMQIYTDGSAVPNPGLGGWAYAVIAGDNVIEEQSGHEPSATSNQMELRAIIEALKWLNADTPAVLYTDSQLSIKVLTKQWRAKQNRDLVQAAQRLLGKREVELRWVRAHTGDRWNEYVDRLAKEAAVPPRSQGTSGPNGSPKSKRSLRVDLSETYLDNLVSDGWITAEELDDPGILGAAMEDRDDCQKRGTFQPGPIAAETTKPGGEP